MNYQEFFLYNNMIYFVIKKYIKITHLENINKYFKNNKKIRIN